MARRAGWSCGRVLEEIDVAGKWDVVVVGAGNAAFCAALAAAENGAKVPITVEMDHPMLAEHHVATVRVANDRDPIPGKGEFHFTPANGHAYLAFQARLDQGSSIVAVSADSAGTIASSSGRASVAPRPRKNVRRGNDMRLMNMVGALQG